MTIALNHDLVQVVTERPKLRVIIYVRASVDPNGKKSSVTVQINQGKRWCAANNAEVVKILSDNNISASRYSRKQRQTYGEMLRLLSTGAANAMWTKENSRANRKLDGFVELRALLEEHGGYWIYKDRIYDMRIPKDRTDAAQDALDAEKEADHLHGRVADGIELRAYNGEYAAKSWFGHMKQWNQDTGEIAIVKHPEYALVASTAVKLLLASKTKFCKLAREWNEAGVVCPGAEKWIATHLTKLAEIAKSETAWQRLLDRLSPERRESAVYALRLLTDTMKHENKADIARTLNAENRPHVFPGIWTGKKVRAALMNPALAGLQVHRGKVIGRGNWWTERAIRDDEHYRLKAKFGTEDSANNKDGDRVKYLLSGPMVCDVCDVGLSGHPDGAYRCQNGHMARNMALCDEYVVAVIVARLQRPDVAELFRVQADDGDSAREAQASLLGLRERLEEFVKSAARGELSASSLVKIEEHLLPQIEAAEDRVRALAVAPLVAEVAGPDAPQAWEALELIQKRDVIRALVTPRLQRQGRGPKKFDPTKIVFDWKQPTIVVPVSLAA